MLNHMSFWAHLEKEISWMTGKPFRLISNQSVAGGCINQACRLADGERTFFVKFNQANLLPMFEAEAQALSEMMETQSLRVPMPFCTGVADGKSYLAMEYVELKGRVDMGLFGKQLALMHTYTAPQFGWSIENTIGTTAQTNQPCDHWVEFWAQQRLGFQLALAARNGYGGELQRLGERLLADFPRLFANYTPLASMLHGDLWGGNFGALQDGTPVVYDPALYYGDREAELAMTTLFGGFGSDFYAAYETAWPLDTGYEIRKDFYNIYHIINHLNLFGGAYQSQAINMIKSVLAHL